MSAAVLHHQSRLLQRFDHLLLAADTQYMRVTSWSIEHKTHKTSAAQLVQEASSAAPIFGSASTFSSGSGFAGFTGIDSSKSKAVASQSAENQEEEDAGNDEECGAEYAPVVQLQEVETSTGEETETALFDV